jgi:hypothetical protein
MIGPTDLLHPSPAPHFETCHLRNNVEKYSGARDATDDNIALARCMLDKQGYTRAHTHRFVILISLPGQQWLRECVTVTLYVLVYCVLVHFACDMGLTVMEQLQTTIPRNTQE